MKKALQITSWLAVVIAALTIINGLSTISSDPTNSHNALLGGLMFGVEGVLALIYVNQNKTVNL